MDVWKKNGGYTFAAEYRADMYTRDQMEWMADLYGTIVRGLMTRKTLSDLPLLSPAAEKFLHEVNDTDVPLS